MPTIPIDPEDNLIGHTGTERTTEVGLTWEDPPPPVNRNSITKEVLDLLPELRQHPGQWAKVATLSSASNTYGYREKFVNATGPDFEFKVYNRVATGGEPEKHFIFARYVGGGVVLTHPEDRFGGAEGG